MNDLNRGDISQNNRKGKGLIITLAVLAIAIVGLTVGIIIATPSNDSLVPKDLNLSIKPDENGDTGTSYGQVYDDAKTKSETLLEENPENIEVVKAIYDELINDQKTRSENPTYIGQFMVAEADILAENGYKREALNELLNRDISDLELNQYTLSAIYRSIIKLAGELGEEEIEDEYIIKHVMEIKVIEL